MSYAAEAGDAAASHGKHFLAKLIRFGQFWSDLGDIKAKGKFRQNSTKIKILHPQKHSISYGYVDISCFRNGRLPTCASTCE